MKKMTLLFVLLISFVLFNHTEVHAQNQSIDFDKNISDSFTATNQIKSYSFTVKKAGKITANVTSYNPNLLFSMYDYELDEIRELTDFSLATKTNGQLKVTSVYLEPGTYTIQIRNPTDSWEEDVLDGYSFKVAFKDSKTTEVEANSNIETAQPLVLGANYKVSQLSWNDAVDYYKVTLKKAGYVMFRVSSNIKGLDIKLINHNGYLIDGVSGSTKVTERDGEILAVGEYVEKGTYYLKVEPSYSADNGIYKVQTNTTAENNKEVEPNNSFEKAEKITPNKGARTGLISWNDAVDYYKFVVPKKTTVKIAMWSHFSTLEAALYNSKFERINYEFNMWADSGVDHFDHTLGKGTYYLKFYASGGLGKYGFSTSIDLNPSLKVNAVDNKHKKISGKTEANATVRMYVNNKLVKTVQANSKGNYSYTYKKLKARNSVKVIATNKAGGKTTKQILVRGV